jgi:Zinc knuckle
MSWDEFKTAMIERYNKTAIRNDLLRQQLEKVRFEGPSKIVEYCTAFCTIEQQLFHMDFDDKLPHFVKPLPIGANLHIKLMDLRLRDMDILYQAARQWVHVFEDSSPNQPPSRGHMQVVQFSRKHSKKKPPAATTQATVESADEVLDTINCMEGKTGKCFTCGEHGHYANECPKKGVEKGDWRGGKKPSRRGMEQEEEDGSGSMARDIAEWRNKGMRS